MIVKLIEHTPNPDRVIAYAASQCYSEGFAGDAYEDENHPLNIEGLIKHVINCGHTSTLEHASFTFAISGVSRVLTHQLVRLRIASYSQQSQRYVKFSDEFKYVTPPSITNSRWLDRYQDLMVQIANTYSLMVEDGIPAEDARFVAPNAAETMIWVTMNARELHHAANLRCCERAQWEIRHLFRTMMKLAKNAAKC